MLVSIQAKKNMFQQYKITDTHTYKHLHRLTQYSLITNIIYGEDKYTSFFHEGETGVCRI